MKITGTFLRYDDYARAVFISMKDDEKTSYRILKAFVDRDKNNHTSPVTYNDKYATVHIRLRSDRPNPRVRL